MSVICLSDGPDWWSGQYRNAENCKHDGAAEGYDVDRDVERASLKGEERFERRAQPCEDSSRTQERSGPRQSAPNAVACLPSEHLKFSTGGDRQKTAAEPRQQANPAR